MAEDKRSVAEIEAEMKRIQLETAQIELEQAREKNEAYKAQKASRIRQNEQTLEQMRIALQEKRQIIKICTHRQGGAPGGRERSGKGPSALRVVVLPDERELVMCGNCPLRVFSPLPTDKNPRPRKGETAEQAKARVEAYQAAQKEFDRLKEEAQDQLTPEAAQPMHCGKTFQFKGRDGNQVTMPAPCDSYAQGLDNRKDRPAA